LLVSFIESFLYRAKRWLGIVRGCGCRLYVSRDQYYRVCMW